MIVKHWGDWGVAEKKCSKNKLYKIHRKIPVLESLFNNAFSYESCEISKITIL